MPGLTCAVTGCRNRWKSSKIGEKLTFHVFPKQKDSLSITVRKKWIAVCKRPANWNPDNGRICAAHFSDQDYERDLQNEVLGLPLRKRLKKTAVPSLNLPDSQVINSEVTKSDGNGKKRKLETIDHIQYISQHLPSNAIEMCYESKYNDLLSEFTKLKENYTNLQKSSRMKIKLLNNNLKYYKKKCVKLDANLNGNNDSAKKLLKKLLTENQISLLLNKKKRVNWTQEEISNAFILRYYSKKCYLYIRNKLHYPLPGLSSLKRWASKINMHQGILRNMLTFLNLAGEGMKDSERTVVISFDEVKAMSVLDDRSIDKIIDNHNYMQVIMARGLFSNWKQPIYLGFEEKVTKEILLNVITELHKISYNVVACVSNYGGSNIGLWEELDININNTAFQHPETNENIYMFADAPHLLKLLRNRLLDTGFNIGNVIINKKPLENLIQNKDQVPQVCYKISAEHIEVEKAQRQNVRMAAELLSNSVGEALIEYKPGDDKKLAEDVGNFICDINKWFDIFNSYVKTGTSPFKCGYGTHLELQESHLNNVLQKVKLMKAHGKSSLESFQKGMIISIKSLKLLYNQMKNKYNIGYLYTDKLNQDCLQNFVFQICSSGPNERPSPLMVIKRMRMIMLGKTPEVFAAHANKEGQVVEEYISSSVMLKANIKVSEDESDGNYFSSQSTSFSSNPLQNDDINETSPEIIYNVYAEDEHISKEFNRVSPDLEQHSFIEYEHDYNLTS